jgi:hypothetical protein
MLSAIGLACDLVGAIMLAVGLFRLPRPTMRQWEYTPEDAAKDSAFGIAGASLLAFGFISQCLPYVGVTVHASAGSTRIAVVAALAVASLYAYLAYGISFIVVFNKRLRWAEQQHPSITPRFRWTPKFPRVWAFVPVRDDTGAQPGAQEP